MSVVPLYRRVLGARFDALMPEVAALHLVEGVQTWRGVADVERGNHVIARVIAATAGLPASGRGIPLAVTFTPAADGRETWERNFAGRRFRSVQRDAGDGLIAERVGLVALLLRPEVCDGELSLTLVGARLIGVPLPRAILPRVATRERSAAGCYRFDVAATLPLVGLLIHYTGTLTRDG